MEKTQTLQIGVELGGELRIPCGKFRRRAIDPLLEVRQVVFERRGETLLAFGFMARIAGHGSVLTGGVHSRISFAMKTPRS